MQVTEGGGEGLGETTSGKIGMDYYTNLYLLSLAHMDPARSQAGGVDYLGYDILVERD